MMKISMKKAVRRMALLSVWILAVLMALFVFVQVAFWGGIVWINSNSGQSFVQSALGQQLEDSPYRIEIGGLSYVFPTVAGLGNITIYQGGEPLFEAHRVSLGLGIFPLSAKTIKIDFYAGEVILQRNDKAPKASVSKSPLPIILKSFTLPNEHFDHFVISDITIDKLVIGSIELSPKLSGDVLFENERLVDIDLKYTDRLQNSLEYMPGEITVQAQFNTRLSTLKVSNIDINSPAYKLGIGAEATFREGGDISVTSEVALKEIANLSPVTISFKAKNAAASSAHLVASGKYFEKEISLATDLSFGDGLALKDIKIKAPDLTAAGQIDLGGGIKGQLSGRLEKLGAYQAFIGTGHNLKPLNFAVDIEGQAYKIELSTKGYSNRNYNVAAKDIKLDALLAGGVFRVNSLTMRDDDKGKLKGSGTFDLSTHASDFYLKATDLNLLKGRIANGLIDADIKVSGTPEEYKISGKISPEKIDIKIPERFSGSIPQLNVETKNNKPKKKKFSFNNIMLDVLVDAPRQIMVRGWGLDAEFGGSLEIKGRVDDPLVYGDFEALRGRYSEFGKVFKFTKAKMTFSGSVPPSPTLDIQTKGNAGEVVAIVNIAGSVLKPEISFSSEPVLPQDEVMSHILFGEDLKSISPFQAVQLAQALSRFTGQGGGASAFDPVGALRDATGLDDLRVGTDEQGGANFGAGKYLSDKVYLEFESGTEEGSGSANVQVEITPNVTVESEIGQDASAGGGIFWKWDY